MSTVAAAAVVDNIIGDSPEIPGQCAKSKELRPCSSVEDCYVASGFDVTDIQCVSLTRSESSAQQRYCIRSSIPLFEVNVRRSLSQLSGPRKHHAYARLLSGIGMMKI